MNQEPLSLSHVLERRTNNNSAKSDSIPSSFALAHYLTTNRPCVSILVAYALSPRIFIVTINEAQRDLETPADRKLSRHARG